MKRVVNVRKYTREGYKVPGPIKVSAHTREIELKKASEGSKTPVLDFTKKQEENGWIKIDKNQWENYDTKQRLIISPVFGSDDKYDVTLYSEGARKTLSNYNSRIQAEKEVKNFIFNKSKQLSPKETAKIINEESKPIRKEIPNTKFKVGEEVIYVYSSWENPSDKVDVRVKIKSIDTSGDKILYTITPNEDISKIDSFIVDEINGGYFPESSFKKVTQNPFSIESLKSDIPAKNIESGYRNISFTPEKRVDNVQSSYAQEVNELYNSLIKIAPEEKEQIEEDIQRFKENYKSKYISWLGALGSTASTMITGGSGFNVRQNQKRQRTEDNRFKELIEFKEKVSKKLLSKYRKDGPIKGNDPEAVTKLKEKLAKEESEKEEMKKINALFKKNGKLTREDFKSQELFDRAKNNLRTWTGVYDKPFPPYELSNANGRIKNIKTRVESLSSKKEQGNKEYSINGVKVVEDVTDNRIRLFFDGIPPVEQRNTLKSNGFRWSTYNSAWQRQLTPNAIYTTKNILGGFN